MIPKAVYQMYLCLENCGYATNVYEDAKKHAEKHPLGWPWKPRQFVEFNNDIVTLDDVLEFLRGDTLPNGPMYARNLAVFVEAKFGGAPELASGT